MLSQDPVRVLILDDEEMYRINLTDFFLDEGFSVTTAGSGEIALESVINEKLDVVVVDMRLPGIDGNTFISRAHKIRPELRFIIHTGSTAYSIPNELREIGISEEQVFFKPLDDFSILVEAIRKLL